MGGVSAEGVQKGFADNVYFLLQLFAPVCFGSAGGGEVRRQGVEVDQPPLATYTVLSIKCIRLQERKAQIQRKINEYEEKFAP